MFYKTKNAVLVAGILFFGVSFGVSRTDQFHDQDNKHTFVCSQKALEPKSRETRQYNQDIAEQNRLTKRQTKLLSDTNVANDTCKKLKKKEQARCEGDVAELKAITRELTKIAKRISEYESCKLPPKCGSAENDIFIAPPTENLCSSGIIKGNIKFDLLALGTNGEPLWKWECGNLQGNKTVSCSAQSIMAYGVLSGEWGSCIDGMQYRTQECVFTYNQAIKIPNCNGGHDTSRACDVITNVSVQSSSYYADVIDAANFLSDRDLVPNYSSNPAQYQLNDMITRQELLTMILKAMKIAPASGYQCQNIFSDISDPEICATAETALANGLISKQTNEDGVSFFRGTDFLTLYEMFVLTMKSQCMRSEDVSLSGVREKVGSLGITNANTLNLSQAASKGDTYISLATFIDYFNFNFREKSTLFDSSIVTCANRLNRTEDENVLCNLFPDLCQ